MSVEEWAKREAATMYAPEREVFAAGAIALADLLLSDEAVDALRHEADRHSPNAALATAYRVGCTCGSTFAATQEGWFEFYRHGRRAALQAAIDAVTREAEGNE